MRKMYAIITTLSYPFIWMWLRMRVRKGKEDASRLRERFGLTSLARPKGKLIWIHAASVGEANSVMPLLQRLHDADESIHIVLTTGTVSSAQVVAKRLPERAYHQYVPVDVPFVIRRFLKRLKPDLAIWVESEFWPNMLYQTKQSLIPLYLVNARISEQSAQNWRKARRFFLEMIGCFRAIYAGSKQDQQRLSHLGVPNVKYQGNLKYDAPPPQLDPTGAICGACRFRTGDGA